MVLDRLRARWATSQAIGGVALTLGRHRVLRGTPSSPAGSSRCQGNQPGRPGAAGTRPGPGARIAVVGVAIGGARGRAHRHHAGRACRAPSARGSSTTPAPTGSTSTRCDGYRPRAAASFYLIPIIGVGARRVLLGERSRSSQWIGAAIVLAAVLAILVRAPASIASTVQGRAPCHDRRGSGAGSAVLQGVGREQPAERAATGVQRSIDLDPRQCTLRIGRRRLHGTTQTGAR